MEQFLEKARAKKERAIVGGPLLDRVKARQKQKMALQPIEDHLQGRYNDMRLLVNQIFQANTVGGTRRSAMNLNDMIDYASADFLYTKEDTKNKIVAFADKSQDYEIKRVGANTYICKT